MASVEDRWFVERRQPDGTLRKVPTDRTGTGLRWQVRWRDDSGRPRKKGFARKADAERAAAETEVALARGSYTDPDSGSVRFQVYAEQWRLSQFTDPSTTYQVGLRLRLHVYPVLGGRPLRAITPSMIRQWAHGLTMARSYQRSIFANVSQIFNAAIADDLIVKNPCRSGTVRKPAADPHKIVPWTAEQVSEVHRNLAERYGIIVPVGAGTGLRQGEMFGLSPDDLDFDNGLLAVNRQIKLSPSNVAYLALPKGRKTRVIPMPSSVRDELRAHLDQFPAVAVTLPWDRPDGRLVTVPLVLTSREKKAVNRNYFNAKVWKPALVASGVEPIRENGCHALRHYYASVLLDGGESIRTVSERLGHADPAFTLRTYTHLLPTSESRTRDIIDAAFRTMTPRPVTRPRAPGVPPTR